MWRVESQREAAISTLSSRWHQPNSHSTKIVINHSFCRCPRTRPSHSHSHSALALASGSSRPNPTTGQSTRLDSAVVAESSKLRTPRLAAEKSKREAEAAAAATGDDGSPVTLATVQLEVAKAHTSMLADQAEWEKWRSRAQMLRAYARKRQQGLVEAGKQGDDAAAIMRITTGVYKTSVFTFFFLFGIRLT